MTGFLSSNFNFFLISPYLLGDVFTESLGIEIPFLLLRLLLGVESFLLLYFFAFISGGLSVSNSFQNRKKLHSICFLYRAYMKRRVELGNTMTIARERGTKI
jgi:hypothetical protein